MTLRRLHSLRSSKPFTGVLLRIIQISVLLVFIAIFSAWYYLIGPSNSEHGSVYNHSTNAVWAAHSWSENPHTPAEVRAFVERLAAHGVRYVFLHVGPLEPDGTIPLERYRALGDFLSMARTYGDRMKFLPWIGQLRGKLPLASLAVRRQVVATAEIFIRDFGMDGIHLDIEPIVDGDSDFLYLLEDMKKMLGTRGGLSVALPELIPDHVFRVMRRVMNLKSYLSSDYFLKVAGVADQIAVMTYENSIRSGWLYRFFLKHEVIWLTNLLADSHARVLIGLPTYDEESVSFYPEAENIEQGLLGVIDGLNSWRSERAAFEGVALYGEWTTDSGEWAVMERLFSGKK